MESHSTETLRSEYQGLEVSKKAELIQIVFKFIAFQPKCCWLKCGKEDVTL